MVSMNGDSGSRRTLKAIKYKPGHLDILDQLALPHETKYVSVYSPSLSSSIQLTVKITSSKDGFDAIKSMTVRGAPAIAIVAALSFAVELYNLPSSHFSTASSAIDFIVQRLNYLEGSRLTAVNLFEATAKLRTLVQTARTSSAAAIIATYIAAAEKMLIDDVADNRAIGSHGATWLITQNPTLPKFKVLTHCNTGSLATAGYGTALGVIRSLHEHGVLEHAFCTETRPYNQGSRLTAYELVFEGIPATLVTDSMASALFRKEGGMMRAVIVGEIGR